MKEALIKFSGNDVSCAAVGGSGMASIVARMMMQNDQPQLACAAAQDVTSQSIGAMLQNAGLGR